MRIYERIGCCCMNFPDRDAQILSHILEYCNRIEKTLSRFGRKFDIFLADQDYMDSVSSPQRFFPIFSLTCSVVMPRLKR